MRVLIATTEQQGVAPGDYFCTVDGELVTPVAVECGDGVTCGCNRGFPGLASDRACTTAMVVDRPHISEGDVRDALYDYFDRGGWFDLLREHREDCEHEIDEIIDDMIDEHIDQISMVCDHFPVGTVVERSGTLVVARAFPAAA